MWRSLGRSPLSCPACLTTFFVKANVLVPWGCCQHFPGTGQLKQQDLYLTGSGTVKPSGQQHEFLLDAVEEPSRYSCVWNFLADIWLQEKESRKGAVPKHLGVSMWSTCKDGLCIYNTCPLCHNDSLEAQIEALALGSKKRCICWLVFHQLDTSYRHLGRGKLSWENSWAYGAGLYEKAGWESHGE